MGKKDITKKIVVLNLKEVTELPDNYENDELILNGKLTLVVIDDENLQDIEKKICRGFNLGGLVILNNTKQSKDEILSRVDNAFYNDAFVKSSLDNYIEREVPFNDVYEVLQEINSIFFPHDKNSKIKIENIMATKAKEYENKDHSVQMSEIMESYFEKDIMFKEDYIRAILLKKVNNSISLVSSDPWTSDIQTFVKRVNLIVNLVSQENNVQNLVINNKKTTLNFRFSESYILILELKRSDMEGFVSDTTEEIMNEITLNLN